MLTTENSVLSPELTDVVEHLQDPHPLSGQYPVDIAIDCLMPDMEMPETRTPVKINLKRISKSVRTVAIPPRVLEQLPDLHELSIPDLDDYAGDYHDVPPALTAWIDQEIETTDGPMTIKVPRYSPQIDVFMRLRDMILELVDHHPQTPLATILRAADEVGLGKLLDLGLVLDAQRLVRTLAAA